MRVQWHNVEMYHFFVGADFKVNILSLLFDLSLYSRAIDHCDTILVWYVDESNVCFFSQSWGHEVLHTPRVHQGSSLEVPQLYWDVQQLVHRTRCSPAASGDGGIPS